MAANQNWVLFREDFVFEAYNLNTKISKAWV